MARLRRKATKSDDMVYLGQYDNANNWKAHAAWTGPQILKQLPGISLFSTTVGTGGQCNVVTSLQIPNIQPADLSRVNIGCITGTGVALKSQNPSIRVLG
jgi:cysteine synthase